MSKHIITFVSTYDFKNDDGEQLKGCQVSYIDNNVINEKDQKGSLNSKVTCDISFFERFKNQPVPGVYELTFGQKPTRKGKPVLTLTDAKMLKAIDLQSMIQ